MNSLITRFMLLLTLLCASLETVQIEYKKPKGLKRWEKNCLYLANRQKKIVEQFFPKKSPNNRQGKLDERIDALTTFLFLQWIPFVRSTLLPIQLMNDVPLLLETKVCMFCQAYQINYDEAIAELTQHRLLDLIEYISSPSFRVKVAAKKLKDIFLLLQHLEL